MVDMVLSIKSAEADELARELARTTGESLTVAVTTALRERLDRQGRSVDHVAERLKAVSAVGRGLPRLDNRTDEEILGYDEHGLPS